jgi:hypothetical protein
MPSVKLLSRRVLTREAKEGSAPDTSNDSLAEEDIRGARRGVWVRIPGAAELLPVRHRVDKALAVWDNCGVNSLPTIRGGQQWQK